MKALSDLTELRRQIATGQGLNIEDALNKKAAHLVQQLFILSVNAYTTTLLLICTPLWTITHPPPPEKCRISDSKSQKNS